MPDVSTYRILHWFLEFIGLLVGGAFGFLGYVTLEWNHPTFTIVKFCEKQLKREMATNLTVVSFVFGSILFLTSVLGIVGLARRSASAMHTYASVVNIYLTSMAFCFTFFYFHFDQINYKMKVCMSRVIPTHYKGPWVSDPTAFSFALDKFQYENKCCGSESYKVYESFIGWNKTWDIPVEDMINYDPNVAQQDLSKLRQPVVRLPWTCCKVKADQFKAVYDPQLRIAQLKGALVDAKCTYEVKVSSVNTSPCISLWKSSIGQVTFALLLAINGLVFFNILRCMLGIYQAKAYKTTKIS